MTTPPAEPGTPRLAVRKAWLGFIVNVVWPGLGSVIVGDPRGWGPLLFFFMSAWVAFFSPYVGGVAVAGVWAWGLYLGILLVKAAEPPA